MFRNKEIKRFAVCFMIISVLAVIAGFLTGRTTGFLVSIIITALGVLFYLFTKARYKNLDRLAYQINLVLHNNDHLYITEFDEGELSILQSEITKMTVRICEQNKELNKEKEHLAQSLADIAHQLRTPLTSANLILSLLKKNPDKSQRRELLRENEELFAQMDWLVNVYILSCRYHYSNK